MFTLMLTLTFSQNSLSQMIWAESIFLCSRVNFLNDSRFIPPATTTKTTTRHNTTRHDAARTQGREGKGRKSSKHGTAQPRMQKKA